MIYTYKNKRDADQSVHRYRSVLVSHQHLCFYMDSIIPLYYLECWKTVFEVGFFLVRNHKDRFSCDGAQVTQHLQTRCVLTTN